MEENSDPKKKERDNSAPKEKQEVQKILEQMYFKSKNLLHTKDFNKLGIEISSNPKLEYSQTLCFASNLACYSNQVYEEAEMIEIKNDKKKSIIINFEET